MRLHIMKHPREGLAIFYPATEILIKNSIEENVP